MPSNVIAFTGRRTATAGRNTPHAAPDNVIALANWIGRAMPRRTPNGVFFITHVLATPGSFA